MNIPADIWLTRSDFCAECVLKKLCFPAGVLLHSSLDPHYLRNMCFNTGMGTFQNFCPPSGCRASCSFKSMAGIAFLSGDCLFCLPGLYQERISWWLGEGDDFLWLKGEEITSRKAEDAFSCLSMTALLFFPCLVGIFHIVRKKSRMVLFLFPMSSPQKRDHVMQNKIKKLESGWQDLPTSGMQIALFFLLVYGV